MKEQESVKKNPPLSIFILIIVLIFVLSIASPNLLENYLDISGISSGADKVFSLGNILFWIIPIIICLIGFILGFTKKDYAKKSPIFRAILVLMVGLFGTFFLTVIIRIIINHIKHADDKPETHYQYKILLIIKVLILICIYINAFMIPAITYINDNYIGVPKDNWSKILVKITKWIINLGLISIMIYCSYWVVKTSKEKTISTRKFQVAAIGAFMAGGAAMGAMMPLLGLVSEQEGNEYLAESI